MENTDILNWKENRIQRTVLLNYILSIPWSTADSATNIITAINNQCAALSTRFPDRVFCSMIGSLAANYFFHDIKASADAITPILPLSPDLQADPTLAQTLALRNKLGSATEQWLAENTVLNIDIMCLAKNYQTQNNPYELAFTRWMEFRNQLKSRLEADPLINAWFEVVADGSNDVKFRLFFNSQTIGLHLRAKTQPNSTLTLPDGPAHVLNEFLKSDKKKQWKSFIFEIWTRPTISRTRYILC